ncbi:MAG: peptidylprolyl isomerase [Planctomycetota bacterium]
MKIAGEWSTRTAADLSSFVRAPYRHGTAWRYIASAMPQRFMARACGLSSMLLLAGCEQQAGGAARSDQRAPNLETTAEGTPIVSGEVILRFPIDADIAKVRAWMREKGLRSLEENRAARSHRVGVDGPVLEALAALSDDELLEEATPNYVVAQVGSAILTAFDMETFIAVQKPMLRQIYAMPEGRRGLLETMVDNLMFGAAARDENMHRLPNLKRAIELSADEALADAFVTALTDGIAYTEEQRRQYYEERLDSFQTPGKFKLENIWFAAMDDAEAALAELQAGADFGEVFRASALVEGRRIKETNWLTREQLPKVMGDGVASLEAGQVTSVLETSAGIFICRLLDRQEAEQLSYDAVEDRLRQELVQARRTQLIAERREQLRGRYEVSTYPEAVEQVRAVPGEGGGGGFFETFPEVFRALPR